jgi:hypothetical protein
MLTTKPLGISPLTPHIAGRVDFIPTQVTQQASVPVPVGMPPEVSLDRAVNFIADLSGCGFWRMIWPENLLNAYQKMSITSTNMMIRDEIVYSHIKSVRIQRQAADHQVIFAEALRELADKHGFNLIYEKQYYQNHEYLS